MDSRVTRPFWYDYFLVSQAVQHGAVAPSHIVVLEDSTGLSAEQHQRLTFKLSHLFYNWPVRSSATSLFFLSLLSTSFYSPFSHSVSSVHNKRKQVAVCREGDGSSAGAVLLRAKTREDGGRAPALDRRGRTGRRPALVPLSSAFTLHR